MKKAELKDKIAERLRCLVLEREGKDALQTIWLKEADQILSILREEGGHIYTHKGLSWAGHPIAPAETCGHLVFIPDDD